MEEKTSPATDSAEQQSSRRRGGALKRKASNLNASTPPPSSKRQTREKPSPVFHNGPLTRARLQPNYTDPSGFWDAVIVETPKKQLLVDHDFIARRLASEALETKIESDFHHFKSTLSNSHFLPISSG